MNNFMRKNVLRFSLLIMCLLMLGANGAFAAGKISYGDKLHLVAFDVKFGASPADVQGVLKKKDPAVQWSPLPYPLGPGEEAFSIDTVIDGTDVNVEFNFKKNKLWRIGYTVDPIKQPQVDIPKLQAEAEKIYGKPGSVSTEARRFVHQGVYIAIGYKQDMEGARKMFMNFMDKEAFDKILEEQEKREQ